jgi:small subunit ribosomal protein S4
MARYRGPRLRIIRRLGQLPGLTQKITGRNTPGQHGRPKSKIKLSQYGLRLQEKQKLRFHFGLSESQLLNYVKKAYNQKGSTGEILLTLLEMRLDNILFRLGMMPTLAASRQFISHGHIRVNKKKVDIASFQCQPKDIISVKEKKQSREVITSFLKKKNARPVPPHLSLNQDFLIGMVNDKVSLDKVGLKIKELLIVEYYSRKM